MGICIWEKSWWKECTMLLCECVLGTHLVGAWILSASAWEDSMLVVRSCVLVVWFKVHWVGFCGVCDRVGVVLGSVVLVLVIFVVFGALNCEVGRRLFGSCGWVCCEGSSV